MTAPSPPVQPQAQAIRRTTMNGFGRATGTLVAAAVLVLSGCAGARDRVDVGGPTPGPTGSTTISEPSTVTTDAVLPTDPATPVIEIHHIDAGVDGIRGVRSSVVYGDGTVLRPDDEGGWTAGRLAPGTAEDLAALADSSGLLGNLDFGDPGVTDMGWSTLTLTTTSGSVEHRVYAPGWTDGLTDEQQQARQLFTDFAAEVAGLDGPELTGVPTPYVPDRALMTASSGASSEEDTVDWTGTTPLEALVGGTGCAVLTGADLQAVLGLLPPADEQQGPDAWLLLSTGADTPATVAARVRVLLPHDEGCPAPADNSDPLPEPWPLTDPAPATAWQRWIADQALVGATETDLLGRDASSTADLTWYTYRYSTGTADGTTVIDVVATSQSSRDRDPATFSVRVDASTGTILDHQVG